MNKTQYWILNGLALILAVLLMGHYFFAQSNRRMAEATQRGKAQIANSPQMELALDRMAKRVAIGSEIDPQLSEILIRYGLNVTVEIDGQKKTYP